MNDWHTCTCGTVLIMNDRHIWYNVLGYRQYRANSKQAALCWPISDGDMHATYMYIEPDTIAHTVCQCVNKWGWAQHTLNNHPWPSTSTTQVLHAGV